MVLISHLAVHLSLEFFSICEEPENSLIFIKVLSLLVLANQILREDESVMEVAHDLVKTLLELQWLVGSRVG